MAKFSLLKTDASVKDILSKYEENEGKPSTMNQLFITDLDSTYTEDPHECGDFCTNTEDSNKFALIVKENLGGKLITSAVRTAILSLLIHLIEEKGNTQEFIISRHEFLSSKEVIVFACTFREFVQTYFNDAITDTVNLVICDCPMDD